MNVLWNSTGATTSTVIMGSRMTGAAGLYTSRKAPIVAILNASSDESTMWYPPSCNTILHPDMGLPDSVPFSNASKKPCCRFPLAYQKAKTVIPKQTFSTAGMKFCGTEPPRTSSINSTSLPVSSSIDIGSMYPIILAN